MTDWVRLLLASIVLAAFVIGTYWAWQDDKRLKLSGAGASRNWLSRFKWPVVDSLSVLLWFLLAPTLSGAMKYLALFLAVVLTFMAFLRWKQALTGNSR